jgi:adenylate cyclase
LSEPTGQHRVVPTTARQDGPGPSPDPERSLSSLRALLVPEDEPADRASESKGDAAVSAPSPHDRTGAPIAVTRTFAFVDVTGFTEFCDRHGEHAAIALLTRFRTIVRDVVGRRGVRVGKWLGDGVMVVGVDEGPAVAAVAEAVLRCHAIGIDTHAGLATGTVLLFEGDDYIGRPVNLAARLCDAAEPGEILAGALEQLPAWVEVRAEISVEVAGVGAVDGIRSLGVHHEVARVAVTGGAAA